MLKWFWCVVLRVTFKSHSCRPASVDFQLNFLHLVSNLINFPKNTIEKTDAVQKCGGARLNRNEMWPNKNELKTLFMCDFLDSSKLSASCNIKSYNLDAIIRLPYCHPILWKQKIDFHNVQNTIIVIVILISSTLKWKWIKFGRNSIESSNSMWMLRKIEHSKLFTSDGTRELSLLHHNLPEK